MHSEELGKVFVPPLFFSVKTVYKSVVRNWTTKRTARTFRGRGVLVVAGPLQVVLSVVVHDTGFNVSFYRC